MKKTILTALFLQCMTIEAMAVSGPQIIYVREDGLHNVIDMIQTLFSCLWKDALSFTVAAMAAGAMIFLAVKFKK